MKILLVMASPGPEVGGMEKQVALQAKYLDRYPDCQLSVAASAYYQNLFSDTISFSTIPADKNRRHPFLLWKLLQIIRKFKPDIIHAHGHKAVSITKLIPPFFRSSRFIGTSHGTKRNNSAFKYVDLAFAVSHGVQEALKPIPSVLIENGIEIYQGPAFSRHEVCHALNINPEMPLIIAVGRLAPVKQYDKLIAAFQELPANLLIFGDGPEKSYLASMLKQADKNVFLMGHHPDARGYMAISDLVVITSEREGFSLTMIEALQCEVPVISTKVSGVAGLLPHRCIIPSTEKNALHQQLQGAINNISTIKLELADAFRYAQTLLTCEQVAKRTREQYLILINS